MQPAQGELPDTPLVTRGVAGSFDSVSAPLREAFPTLRMTER
jgi:hypothetical protein